MIYGPLNLIIIIIKCLVAVPWSAKPAVSSGMSVSNRFVIIYVMIDLPEQRIPYSGATRNAALHQ